MAWNFMAPIRDLELGMHLSRFVESLDWADWLEGFRTNFPFAHTPGNEYIGRDATADAPRVLQIQVSEGTLFLLQGVKRLDTATRLAQGWLEAFDPDKQSGINPQVYRAASQVFDGLNLGAENLRNEILIAGHSFGGAVAQSLALWIRFLYPTRNIRIVTFGSPRPGPAPWATSMRQIEHARYWTADDPIPLCPPRRAEAISMHNLLGTTVSNRVESITHSGFGVCLQDGAEPALREYWANPPTFAELNMAAWALGLFQNPAPSHAIHTYWLKLKTWVEAGFTFLPRPTGSPRGGTGDGPPSRPPPTEPTPAVVAQQQLVANAVQTLQQTSIPTYFTASSKPGVWCVYRDEEVVNIAYNRTRARLIARRGNLMIREATARGITDFTSIVQAVATML